MSQAEMHMHRSDAFPEFALPVGKVGLAERQIDGLTVVVVEADADARRLADGGKARTRELDEEFVFVLVGAVGIGDGMRRIFDCRLHLPCGAVRVEDDIGQELRLVKAVVPQREGCPLKSSLARVGCLKVDARIRGEAACRAMVDPVGVGESEDAREDEEHTDEDEKVAEYVLQDAPPFDGDFWVL